MTTDTKTAITYSYAPQAEAEVAEKVFNTYAPKFSLEAMANQLIDCLPDTLPDALDERGIYELRITIGTNVEPVAGGYYDIHFGLLFASELLIGITTECHPELPTSENFADTDDGKRVYSLHLAHLDGWTFLSDHELLDVLIG